MHIWRPKSGISMAMLLLATAAPAGAVRNEAHVTRIIREVKLLPSLAPPKPAALNDTVNDNTAVRTGNASRSELTFVDLRITRLGENTLFTFNRGGHDVQLNSGSMLLYVPKNAGGAQMATSAVSVAITGTTVIFEARKAGRTILKVFEGSARASLIRYPREWVSVRAGQMIDVPVGATEMPQPVNMDTPNELRSPLFTDFSPLPSQGLIATAPNPAYPSGPVIAQPVGPVGSFFPPSGGGQRFPPRGGGRGGNQGTGTGGNAGAGNAGNGKTGGTTNPSTPNPPRGGRFPPPKATKPTSGKPNNPTGTPPPNGTIGRTLPQQPGQMAGKPAGNAGSANVGKPKTTPTPRQFPSRRIKKRGPHIN